MRFRQDFHLHLCLNLRMAAHCSVDRPVTTASCASKALEQSTKLYLYIFVVAGRDKPEPKTAAEGIVYSSAIYCHCYHGVGPADSAL